MVLFDFYFPPEETSPSCFAQHFCPMQPVPLVSHPNQLSHGSGQIHYCFSFQVTVCSPSLGHGGPSTFRKCPNWCTILSVSCSQKLTQCGFGGANCSLMPLPLHWSSNPRFLLWPSEDYANGSPLLHCYWVQFAFLCLDTD